jgi:hypothetical protein
MAWYDFHISTAKLEGFNNKRQAYGYRVQKFFELKIPAMHHKNYAFVGWTLNIILNITNHFSLIPKYKEKGIKLDPISLFRNIIDFHKELEENNIFTTGFSNFITQYTTNISKIVLYTSTIRDLETTMDLQMLCQFGINM